MLHRRFLFSVIVLLWTQSAWAGPQEPTIAASGFPARAEFGRTVALIGAAAGFRPGPVEYRWTQLDLDSTPAVQISAANTRVASFTAPAQAATLRFQFRATAAFQAATDTVAIEVAESNPMDGVSRGFAICPEAGNQPAVAMVPAGLTVESGAQANLAATGGNDPDNSGGLAEVVYQWSVLEGRGVLADEDLSGRETDAVAFVAPDVSSETIVAISLLVSDSQGCGTSYPVAVLVQPQPPPLTASVTARLGTQELPPGDRLVAGESIRLSPGAAYPPGDPQPSQVDFSWRQVEGPPVDLVVDPSGAGFTAPDVESDSAIAFELTADDGERSAQAVISFVIAPAELYFSQVAFGPFRDLLLRTVLVLTNDRDIPAADVRLEFYDFTGAPLALTVDGQVLDPNTPLTIGPGLSRSFTLEGPMDLTTVGWGRVRSDVRLTGLVLYQLVNQGDGTLSSEVSLFASAFGQRFTTYFGRSDGLAMAIANPGQDPTEVSVRVLGEGAAPTEVVERSLQLPPGRQVARFLDASLFEMDFPVDFQAGTLVVESFDAPTILTILKTDAVGLPFSTLPVSTRPSAQRPPPPNDPPVARLLYRVGSSGPFLEVSDGQPVALQAPVEVTLDAGLSSDPEGGALTVMFNLETNLTAGGASLQNVNQSLRLLSIAPETVGTVRVTVTVTDAGGLSASATIVFELS